MSRARSSVATLTAPLSKWSIGVLGVMHAVGVLGFAAGVHGFERLVPIHLLCTIAVWAVNQPRLSPRLGIWLGACAALGFSVEVIGVGSGMLFGEYSYGDTLGPSLFEVPVMMALNWGLLLAVVADVSAQLGAAFRLSRPSFAVLGACLMLALDVVMEPFAMRYELWHWDDGTVPVYNYVSWWFVSCLLLLLYPQFVTARESPVKATPVFTNPVSAWVYTFQLLFFAILLPIAARSA